MITTIIVSTIVALIAVKYSYALGKKKGVKQPPKSLLAEDGAILWKWERIDDENRGFRCPKCQFLDNVASPNLEKDKLAAALAKNSVIHSELCECSEYHQSHFHFLCGTCKFKAIMRTADNS